MRGKVWGSLLLVGALGLACDSATVVEDDLIGAWNATVFVFSDFEDPVTDFNMLQNGGTVTMAIRADGTFTITLGVAGIPPETVDGTWELRGGDVLVITETGETDGVELQIALNGTTLDVYSDDIDFDFGDGEIPAQLDARFVKA